MSHPATMPQPVRIGAVTYLNAQPLVYRLAQRAPETRVIVDLPSRLADGLVTGDLDVAIIPSIEYLRNPGHRIVSDACIACDGPVLSVKLYGRVPVACIRTLALDEGSRTSATLARILLKERYGLSPELRPLAIGASLDDTEADAVVLIGDRGMRPVPGRFAFTWDLGQEWTEWTGLPFVFALWVVRPDVELGSVVDALDAARNDGIEHLPEIAEAAAPTVGIPPAECLCYLRDHLEFHLGPRQRAGLELFYQLAARHGLAPEGGELVFYRREVD